MGEVVNWGILGGAGIARKHIVPAFGRSENARLWAVASRDAKRAAALAAEWGAQRAYGSYEALLADPEVQAVYIPLPNPLHRPWARAALEAGKHVLCEKPLGLDAREVAELIEVQRCSGRLLMEAFMYRFHAQWRAAQDWIAEGGIGPVHAVLAHFSYHNTDPADIRNRLDFGGGGLLDIGCYCVSVARLLFGREPRRVSAWLEPDPAFGVDRKAAGLLDFGSGSAVFYCGTQSQPDQGVTVIGERGRLVFEAPFYRTGPWVALRARCGERSWTQRFPAADHYAEQLRAFSQAVLTHGPAPIDLWNALSNARVLDALFQAAAAGAWAALPAH